MSKNALNYIGFLGFLGFTGFRYFKTGEPTELCGFAAFSFFAYFWIAKLSISIPDERYLENVQKAKAFIGNVALVEMAVLFVLSVLLSQFMEVLIFGIAVVFSSLVLGYAIKLYQLEEK
ncbi:MAG: DUF3796 domain-containing protein [Candidatus Wallacebacter cryptica]|nr:DUF3796 domain-containing protein [Bacillota bacterium]